MSDKIKTKKRRAILVADETTTARKRKQMATQAEMAAFRAQYTFAKDKCGHTVTAATVGKPLGLTAAAIYSYCRNGGNAVTVNAIAGEYRRQISEYVKAKGYDFAVLSTSKPQ